MSLNVEYVFKVLDRFSGPLDRMAEKVNRFNDRIDESTKNMKRMGQGMAKVGAVMSAAVTLPLLMMGKAAISAASDAEETRSKYATVFKDIGDMAEGTADSFAKSFGLAGTTARQLLGDTGDMLTGFGFTSEAALKLSKRTNELAVDLASFTNFSGGAEGASKALTKALLGERESVKSLGIAILEEDVKKKVALLRSQGMKFATDREAKAYATLDIAISQSKNAIGDYARTKKSFANVQRRVAENNRELMESFGRLLIPMATKALNVIDGLQSSFMGLDDGTKKFIMIIAATFAVLGPLILLLGAITMIIPILAAGFAVLTSPITLIVGSILAVVAAVTWLILKFIKLGKSLGWVNAIKESFKAMLDFVINIVKMIPAVRMVRGAMGMLGFGTDNNASSTAQSAARKSEQRVAVSGSADMNINLNNNGEKSTHTATAALGMQGAGAY